jgi:hypothetical protein
MCPKRKALSKKDAPLGTRDCLGKNRDGLKKEKKRFLHSSK